MKIKDIEKYLFERYGFKTVDITIEDDDDVFVKIYVSHYIPVDRKNSLRKNIYHSLTNYFLLDVTYFNVRFYYWGVLLDDI